MQKRNQRKSFIEFFEKNTVNERFHEICSLLEFALITTNMMSSILDLQKWKFED